ncbi:MAG: class I SAM-dependent methyltransferase [Candidatus Binatia bacterium]
MLELSAELEGCIAAVGGQQMDADALLARLARQGRAVRTALDLGCGAGDSVEVFRRLWPAARWIGVDLPASPEVATRTRRDAAFVAFDGVAVPLASATCDLVYSHQVLEHVRHPGALLREVWRVLRRDGVFVGSTSHVEPYHSFSYWNYTPLGFRRLAEEAGLRVLELRPGIDGLTLMVRRVLGRARWCDRWFARESPLNRAVDWYAALRGKDDRWRTTVKLQHCGQFAWVAERADAARRWRDEGAGLAGADGGAAARRAGAPGDVAGGDPGGARPGAGAAADEPDRAEPWYDEGSSLVYSQGATVGAWWQALQRTHASERYQPFYFAVLRGWRAAFGDSRRRCAGCRWPAASPSPWWRPPARRSAARRTPGSPRRCSPASAFAVVYSQEVRPALLLLLAAVQLWSVLRGLARPPRVELVRAVSWAATVLAAAAGPFAILFSAALERRTC